jgi:hypothetical protein
MKKYILLFSILVFCFCSCKDKHDYTPATLEISEDAFDDCFDISNYNVEHDEQITDEDKLRAMKQHKFTHVYVSYGGDALGVWELPCSVPILDATGDSTYINIVPCFKKNGQSSTIKGYGYIKSYKLPVKLQKGVTTYLNKETMHGKYEYHKYATFKMIEPFSSQNSFSPHNTMTSIVNFECVTDPEDPSNRIGILNLTNDSLRGSFEVTTSDITVPVNYQTYLEIRYKCDNDLDIELYAPSYFNIYPCGGLYATDTWETAYINLDEHLVNIYNTGTVFSGSIQFRLLLSGSKLMDRNTQYYIDYVKIITGPQP